MSKKRRRERKGSTKLRMALQLKADNKMGGNSRQRRKKRADRINTQDQPLGQEGKLGWKGVRGWMAGSVRGVGGGLGMGNWRDLRPPEERTWMGEGRVTKIWGETVFGLGKGRRHTKTIILGGKIILRTKTRGGRKANKKNKKDDYDGWGQRKKKTRISGKNGGKTKRMENPQISNGPEVVLPGPCAQKREEGNLGSQKLKAWDIEGKWVAKKRVRHQWPKGIDAKKVS